MRRIDSCNHNIFACVYEPNFFLNEKEWLIPQKKKDFFFFLRGTTRNYYFFVTKLTMDQFPFHLGVLNTPIILSFMFFRRGTMSDPGHPFCIE